MDSLHINALNVATRIGVHSWEQAIKQTVLIDIIIPMDFRACEDKLDKTIDYDLLCQTVTQYVESKSFQLIETIAHEVALLIQHEFKVESVRLTVSKPHAVRNAGLIQVQVNR